jgi:DNA-binding CsgD family transcriptional regulator
MRVLGRDSEVAMVERNLDGVGRGFAAIVISGDPGIGKTTVWRYGVTAAQARGFQVICCRPAEPEIWLSFSGLADLIAEVPVEMVDTLPGPQRDALDVALLKRTAPKNGTDHRAISTAVTSVVRNLVTTAPVVIAVDDLQWLDAATAEVLAYMLRRLASKPVLLLVTVRDGPGLLLPAGLGRVLDGDRVRHMQLGPLAARELCELVRNLTGLMLAWPELLRLHEASGGNPLLAVEIARALDRSGTQLAPGEPLPVPKSIAALVTEQVSALPATTRTALLAASALAHPTVGQIRAAMSVNGERLPGSGEGLLDSAEDHGVVHIRDGVVSFAHPLFSSAIYSAAPPARRRWMHRQLAEIVSDDEERAWHMALAVPGPDPEVAAAVEKAARAAQARGALHAAARLWELASHRTPASDPDGATPRTMAAAMCLFNLGDAGRARSMLEAVAEGTPPGPQRAKVLLWLATILYHQSSSVRAAALCRQALAEAGHDRLTRARLHLRAAWFTQDDAVARVRHAEAAAALLRSADTTAGPDLLACTDLARGYYRFLAGYGVGSCDLERNRSLLTRSDRSWERAWALYLACQWTKSLDLPKARADCLAVLQQTADSGDELTIAHILFHLAETECWLGQLDQAKVHAAEAAAGFEHTGQGRWRGLGLYIQALPDAYLGEVDAAGTLAERGLEIVAPDDDPYVGALLLGMLGFIALTLGEPDEADRHLSRADELVTSMGLAEPARHRFHGDHLETVLAMGDLARADVLQQRLEHRVRVAPYPWLAMITARGRALLYAARCDLDAAARAIQEALCHAQAAAMPFEHARTLLAAGRIRRRRKEKMLAHEALHQAQEIFDALPNALWAAQATAEIQRLGVRSASPHGLTPTEERVARLAADGHTNTQIAGTLHISKKTVEANLSRVFRKLRIRSRRELTGSVALRHEREQGFAPQ